MALRKIRLYLELNPGPDRVYTITSPDVPGLVTEGSTPEEIARNVQDAIECLLAGWKKYGVEIPPALRNQPEDQPPAATIESESLVIV
jgi:antitoxin HicB